MSDTYRLTVEVPAVVKQDLPDAEARVKRFLAMELYKQGNCSLGWAANAAGMNREDFADFLIGTGVEILEPTLEETLAEIADMREARHKEAQVGV
jgi:predicted HTH domain antitoxin